jgi:hypothetical protein
MMVCCWFSRSKWSNEALRQGAEEDKRRIDRGTVLRTADKTAAVDSEHGGRWNGKSRDEGDEEER